MSDVADGEGSKIKFHASVDLGSVDAMFAATGVKMEALSRSVDVALNNIADRMGDRLQALGMRLDERLDRQDGALEDIKIQTTKTNGRVTKVEDRTTAIEEYKASVRNRIAGFIAFGTAAGVLVGWAIQSGARITFK